jgi:hypothetical protein
MGYFSKQNLELKAVFINLIFSLNFKGSNSNNRRSSNFLDK